MSIKNASKLFFGSVIIYVTMASCVASERATMSSAATTGTNGAGGNGGSMAQNTGIGGAGGITDPIPDANAGPGSGLRLKARYFVGTDGSSVQSNEWFDSVRGEMCAMLRASDGTMRCMPYRNAVAGVWYVDALCTQRLAVWNYDCLEQPKYASEAKEACGGSSLYALGEMVTPAEVYVSISGVCQKQMNMPSGKLFAVGTEIAPADFVEVKPQTGLLP